MNWRGLVQTLNLASGLAIMGIILIFFKDHKDAKIDQYWKFMGVSFIIYCVFKEIEFLRDLGYINLDKWGLTILPEVLEFGFIALLGYSIRQATKST